jgi:hypothetical protein
MQLLDLHLAGNDTFHTRWLHLKNNANAYNLYLYSNIVADIPSAVAGSTCGPGRTLSLDLLIGCCLGQLLGAAGSYSWGDKVCGQRSH